ncbi:MAG: hypothetical protein IJR99_14075 [Kiritimatiellae bacterium]|nr:hypothetical protein [Kiritimatiellia bacterium]
MAKVKSLRFEMVQPKIPRLGSHAEPLEVAEKMPKTKAFQSPAHTENGFTQMVKVSKISMRHDSPRNTRNHRSKIRMIFRVFRVFRGFSNCPTAVKLPSRRKAEQIRSIESRVSGDLTIESFNHPFVSFRNRA